MAYEINGTELNLQPTSGRWITQDVLGFSGNGHPEYSGVREFEMTWALSPMADANEVQGLYDQLNVTGTATVTIPQYKAPSWQFHTYSGTTLGEPTSSEYFEQHETEIRLIVYKIRT